MTTVNGKVAFVTGGASGIGFGLAKVLGAAGARIVVADVEAGPAEEAVRALEKRGVEAMGIPLDVTDREAFAAARDRAIERFGGVQLLFNNAGVNASAPFHELSYADWDWVMGVNLGGVINGLVTFLPELIRHGADAHVVSTASMGGLVGLRGLGPYNASKFGVVGLSECLRNDMHDAGTGVGVSVLCPGIVKTSLGTSERNRPAALGGGEPAPPTPASRATESGMDPEELGRRVLSAVEEDRFFIATHPEFRDLVAARNRAVDAAVVHDGEPDAAVAKFVAAMAEPW